MKKVHVLIETDPEAGTGVCRHCGPVAVISRTQSGRDRKSLRCSIGVKQGRNRSAVTGEPYRYIKKPHNVDNGLSPHGHGLRIGEAKKYREGRACAICGSNEPSKTSVDHCHTTKLIRGVLCCRCNRGLGFFQDDPALLMAAINYLAQPGMTPQEVRDLIAA